MAAFPDSIDRLADASPLVLDAVLRLNRRHERELSGLDGRRLDALIGEAFHATVIGEGAAFLLALDQDAAYDSRNYQWFRWRYPRFVYIDRVAVAAVVRGKGLASQLYRELFEIAGASGHSIVACEVNVDPPNPASDAFHEAHGFKEVGRAALATGKTVRYLVRRLAASRVNQPAR